MPTFEMPIRTLGLDNLIATHDRYEVDFMHTKLSSVREFLG